LAALQDAFEHLAALRPAIPPEMVLSVRSMADRGRLADVVVGPLQLPFAERQRLLECGETAVRAERVLRFLRDASEGAEVERKVRLWDGFCDVDVRLDESLADSSDNAVIVGRVVEESVANSIRHGQASHINVDVSCDADGRVQVSIIDNGTGPQGGSRGMGSAYLSMVSDGGWTMEATEHGTRVLVPIGPSPGR
jgi:signal transduction histidine kinase